MLPCLVDLIFVNNILKRGLLCLIYYLIYRLSHDRCSHWWCRSRRFDCILLVFFRRWGRLVMRHLIEYDALLWLERSRWITTTFFTKSLNLLCGSIIVYWNRKLKHFCPNNSGTQNWPLQHISETKRKFVFRLKIIRKRWNMNWEVQRSALVEHCYVALWWLHLLGIIQDLLH